MSAWVLLWLVAANGKSVTSGSMIFATQAACEAAAAPFTEQTKGWARDGFAVCVEDPEPPYPDL